MRLTDLETPALILDRARMDANIARMNAAIRRHGVTLRPHLKTVKSIEPARAMTAGWPGPITVSTLKEAEAFLAAGWRDILYAVGIAPGKLSHVARLRASDAELTIITDNLAAAESIGTFGSELPTLIEIDSDGKRAGVRADDEATLLAISEALGPNLRGVMTHCGGSYASSSDAELTAYAEQERAAVVRAAEILRAAGLSCPIVSVGSTPTALFAGNLNGVTEVRAGVYATQDLVIAGMGACAVGDIALSVLTAVIGHQPERGWLIVDAGWMALSRDRGTAAQAMDHGYGLVCDVAGNSLDLVVESASQEHGIVAARGGALDVSAYPVGTLLRVLPNHACATAAQHMRYEVVEGGDEIVASWERFGGW